jgi:hypothetical protein
MTKIVVRVFIIMLFVFSKGLVAQTISAFEQVHNQLLNDYIVFIDSTEKKQPFGSYFQIHKRKHISVVEFRDEKLVYRISKKVKVYKNGVRYEKVDWSIRYPHKIWHHKLYEIKQMGHNYRFIEQINYDFGKKLKETKITTSIDDNYLRVKILSPDDKKATYLYVKPASSLPLIHQD